LSTSIGGIGLEELAGLTLRHGLVTREFDEGVVEGVRGLEEVGGDEGLGNFAGRGDVGVGHFSFPFEWLVVSYTFILP
jgi:hypothetical protein